MEGKMVITKLVVEKFSERILASSVSGPAR
jgi:hypothetical protein